MSDECYVPDGPKITCSDGKRYCYVTEPTAWDGWVAVQHYRKGPWVTFREATENDRAAFREAGRGDE